MQHTQTPPTDFPDFDFSPSGGDALGLLGDIFDLVRQGRAALRAQREQDDDGIIELTDADRIS